jgi:hypothetical protein
MPHDRIWMKDGKPDTVSYVTIGEHDGFETLEEERVPIAEVDDSLIKLFVDV